MAAAIRPRETVAAAMRLRGLGQGEADLAHHADCVSGDVGIMARDRATARNPRRPACSRAPSHNGHRRRPGCGLRHGFASASRAPTSGRPISTPTARAATAAIPHWRCRAVRRSIPPAPRGRTAPAPRRSAAARAKRGSGASAHERRNCCIASTAAPAHRARRCRLRSGLHLADMRDGMGRPDIVGESATARRPTCSASEIHRFLPGRRRGSRARSRSPGRFRPTRQSRPARLSHRASFAGVEQQILREPQRQEIARLVGEDRDQNRARAAEIALGPKPQRLPVGRSRGVAPNFAIAASAMLAASSARGTSSRLRAERGNSHADGAMTSEGPTPAPLSTGRRYRP